MADIDLNSDLGESFGVWRLGDDEAMLEVVTSANVACGFHAGDPSTLRAVCAAATTAGVTVGAQVGYPDLAGFGRRAMDMAPAELRDAVLYQLGALDAFAQVAGSDVGYVKPHGALYHVAGYDAASAAAIVQAAAEYDPSLAILGAPGSLLLRQAEEAGLEAVPEAFADRAYQPDGSLVSRRQSGSVIVDPAVAAAQAVRLAVDQQVVAIDGSVVAVGARSLCVHGDTPGAVDVARGVRAALESAGVHLVPFAA